MRVTAAYCSWFRNKKVQQSEARFYDTQQWFVPCDKKPENFYTTHREPSSLGLSDIQIEFNTGGS